MSDGGGDAFYDDNEWDALAKLQWYHQAGDRDALRRAKQIFELVVYGWDDDPSHAHPGGVFWTQASWSQDRNTVSNGPGAEVGLHLYEISGQRRYLSWAKQMIDWVDTGLLSPRTACTGTTSGSTERLRRPSGATTRASCSEQRRCCTGPQVTRVPLPTRRPSPTPH